MNDDKFKKGIRRSFVLFFIGIIFIIIMVLYISISPNLKKTIYDEYSASEEQSAEVSKIFLETKGVNKEELEKYLSVGAILKREEFPNDVAEVDNYKYMLLALNFLNDVKGEGTESDEEKEVVTVDAEKIEKVLKELNGKFVKDNLNVTGYYEFAQNENGLDIYNIKMNENFMSYLVEFSEAEFKDDIIEVRFKNVFGTNEEISKLINNEKVSLKTYEYKAIIKENLTYDYSKYYINNVEILNSEMVEYN